jgi:hypothetical protein
VGGGGHFVRTAGNELPKKILGTNPGGQRGRGRPKASWIDGVQEDARQPGSRIWLANIQDRGRWRRLLEEVKAHPGLWNWWWWWLKTSQALISCIGVLPPVGTVFVYSRCFTVFQLGLYRHIQCRHNGDLGVTHSHKITVYNSIFYKTRGVLGHPVGTKFLLLYIMY